MKIKTARIEDIRKICELYAAQMKDLGETPPHNLESLIRKYWDKQIWFLFYDAHDFAFGMAYAVEQIVYSLGKVGYYIGGAFILPEWRGRGLYRQAMNQIESWAKDRGAVELFARIRDDNDHSIKSLLAFGWHKVKYGNYVKALQ